MCFIPSKATVAASILNKDLVVNIILHSLTLDVDFSCNGFVEFIYPQNWVGDQTLLYRAAGKAEMERSLDPPPVNCRRNVNEPVVAFGPPGSTGELNVSVIVSPVSLDFS